MLHSDNECITGVVFYDIDWGEAVYKVHKPRVQSEANILV